MKHKPLSLKDEKLLDAHLENHEPVCKNIDFKIETTDTTIAIKYGMS